MQQIWYSLIRYNAFPLHMFCEVQEIRNIPWRTIFFCFLGILFLSLNYPSVLLINMSSSFLCKLISWWSSSWILFATPTGLLIFSPLYLVYTPTSVSFLTPYASSSSFSAFPNPSPSSVHTSNPILSDFCFDPQCSIYPLSLL